MDDLSGIDVEPLSVLVVGTDDWAVDQAVAALAARGHRPLTCHRSGEPAFPCNALLAARTCPLDAGFSVVVTVRARMSRVPSESEFGVVCGLHAGAELVVAGVSVDNPYERWCQRVVQAGGDLVTECERAARDARQAATVTATTVAATTAITAPGGRRPRGQG